MTLPKVSLARPDLKVDPEDPPGFRAAMFRFGADLGAVRTGTTLYELPPGEAVCPYHYEHHEEEWLLVLAGHPTLREPGGEQRLEPMDVVFFPPGPEAAHQIRNDTDEPVRVLMWGENLYPAATTYPDSQKIGIWLERGEQGKLYRLGTELDYFDGEGETG
ncbi:MAG TPA: cupin domain-containing protein [Solirubrobacteraceae bacterium]|jgi:uncharacterized cupin superfamily protein